ITHYGEFTGYNVRNFNKLIGRDIIVAHQLLKNDIDQHEYWLVTRNLLAEKEPPGLRQWMEWNSSAKQTEGGVIPFHYAQLSQLKNEIPPDPLVQLDLSQKTKLISFDREYDTDIISLFHLTGDFNYRKRWEEGVVSIEELPDRLPRLGMQCVRTMTNGKEYVYASSYSYRPDHIEFSETEQQSKRATYFTLDKISDNRTRLRIDYYCPKRPGDRLFFGLFEKKQVKSRIDKSLDKLEALTKEVKI
ncbi:MAG: DUF2652 domain-containing protein, partial [Bacteroidetes bacterium]|nr:DUF2652 domain-containing protein [Bacteroidota bacterium]